MEKYLTQLKKYTSLIEEKLNKNKYTAKCVSSYKQYKIVKILTILCCLFIGYYALFSEKVYLGKDVNCILTIEPETESCTDKNGNPITGIVKTYSFDLITLYGRDSYENATRFKEMMHPSLNWRTNYITGIVHLKNGKADGYHIGYFPNGKINIKTPYKNGTADGIKKIYNDDGTLKEEVLIIDGYMKN